MLSYNVKTIIVATHKQFKAYGIHQYVAHHTTKTFIIVVFFLSLHLKDVIHKVGDWNEFFHSYFVRAYKN